MLRKENYMLGANRIKTYAVRKTLPLPSIREPIRGPVVARREFSNAVAAALDSPETSTPANWEIRFSRSDMLRPIDDFGIRQRDDYLYTSCLGSLSPLNKAIHLPLTSADKTTGLLLVRQANPGWTARTYHSPMSVSKKGNKKTAAQVGHDNLTPSKHVTSKASQDQSSIRDLEKPKPVQNSKTIKKQILGKDKTVDNEEVYSPELQQIIIENVKRKAREATNGAVAASSESTNAVAGVSNSLDTSTSENRDETFSSSDKILRIYDFGNFQPMEKFYTRDLASLSFLTADNASRMSSNAAVDKAIDILSLTLDNTGKKGSKFMSSKKRKKTATLGNGKEKLYIPEPIIIDSGNRKTSGKMSAVMFDELTTFWLFNDLELSDYWFEKFQIEKFFVNRKARRNAINNVRKNINTLPSTSRQEKIGDGIPTLDISDLEFYTPMEYAIIVSTTLHGIIVNYYLVLESAREISHLTQKQTPETKIETREPTIRETVLKSEDESRKMREETATLASCISTEIGSSSKISPSSSDAKASTCVDDVEKSITVNPQETHCGNIATKKTRDEPIILTTDKADWASPEQLEPWDKLENTTQSKSMTAAISGGQQQIPSTVTQELIEAGCPAIEQTDEDSTNSSNTAGETITLRPVPIYKSSILVSYACNTKDTRELGLDSKRDVSTLALTPAKESKTAESPSESSDTAQFHASETTIQSLEPANENVVLKSMSAGVSSNCPLKEFMATLQKSCSSSSSSSSSNSHSRSTNISSCSSRSRSCCSSSISSSSSKSAKKKAYRIDTDVSKLRALFDFQIVRYRIKVLLVDFGACSNLQELSVCKSWDEHCTRIEEHFEVCTKASVGKPLEDYENTASAARNHRVHRLEALSEHCEECRDLLMEANNVYQQLNEHVVKSGCEQCHSLAEICATCGITHDLDQTITVSTANCQPTATHAPCCGVIVPRFQTMRNCMES